MCHQAESLLFDSLQSLHSQPHLCGFVLSTQYPTHVRVLQGRPTLQHLWRWLCLCVGGIGELRLCAESWRGSRERCPFSSGAARDTNGSYSLSLSASRAACLVFEVISFPPEQHASTHSSRLNQHGKFPCYLQAEIINTYRYNLGTDFPLQCQYWIVLVTHFAYYHLSSAWDIFVIKSNHLGIPHNKDEENEIQRGWVHFPGLQKLTESICTTDVYSTLNTYQSLC